MGGDLIIWLVGALGAVLAIFGYGVKKKHDGKKEASNESAHNALEKVVTANEIDDEVDSLEPDDVKRRLFDEYGK